MARSAAAPNCAAAVLSVLETARSRRGLADRLSEADASIRSPSQPLREKSAKVVTFVDNSMRLGARERGWKTWVAFLSRGPRPRPKPDLQQPVSSLSASRESH